MSRPMKETNIPWIGQIPVQWGVAKLKKVATIVTGNTPSKLDDGYYSDSGIEWLKPENLMGTKGVTESKEKLNSEGASLARITPPYTILICCIGNVGKFGYITTAAAFNQQINGIIFSAEKINWKFGMYYMSSQKEQQQFFQNGNVMKILNTENQKKVTVTVPPLEEQRKIAAFLDDKTSQIDSIIDNTKQSIVELKKYKQSLITETVTNGLNPDVKMKDSEIEWIGEIPEHWEKLKVKYASYLKGRIGWQGLTSDEYQNEGPYLITGKDFDKGSINWNTCTHIAEARYQEAPDIHVKNNDLLITKDGTIGKVALISNLSNSASLNSGVLLVRKTKELYVEKFLYHVLNSQIFWRWYNLIKSPNSTILHLYQNDFKDFAYPLPSTQEQQQIADFLDEKCAHIDSLIADKEKLISEFEDYKKSLIYEYVTGKKAVD